MQTGLGGRIEGKYRSHEVQYPAARIPHAYDKVQNVKN